MRVHSNNKLGFSALELLFVLIIIIILSMLMYPRFLALIENSRSTEAFSTLGTIRRSMERCASYKGGDFSECRFGKIDMGNPNTSPGAHFSYDISEIGKTIIITATRNTFDNGDGESQIMLIMSPDGMSKAGKGRYSYINRR